MDSVEPNGKVSPCVEVVEAYGEGSFAWVEDDQELTRSFELESFALAFAEVFQRRPTFERGLRDFSLS